MTKHIILLFSFSILSAQTEPAKTESFHHPNGSPSFTLININNIAAWYAANGEQEHSRTGNSGVIYPRGTSTTIFSAGLMWGGLVKDGKLPELRVNGHSYAETTDPGAIIDASKGIVQDLSDPAVRIWRIRRDYATADLQKDAAEYNSRGVSQVTPALVESLRANYERDWKEWPAAYGAPYYDRNKNGIYDPTFLVGKVNNVDVPDTSGDQPGLLEADQVIWYVFNDLKHDSPWQSPPVGLEVQNTIWAYNSVDGLDDVIFKRFRMIYKGTPSTPANAWIDSIYFCQWSDPDVGDAGDDFVGCDTVLGIGYSYNSRPEDIEYQKHGATPPAIGYRVLQGPTYNAAQSDHARYDFSYRKGYKNRSMTSFVYSAPGIWGIDPPPYSANGAVQNYKRFRGLPPGPQGPPPPPPFVDPTTNKPTGYWLYGNPIDSTGWVDGVINEPGERSIWINSGPFTMALGDTQEIIIALAGGTGSSAKTSISVMKYNLKQAKQFFEWQFPDVITEAENNVISSPQSFVLHQNYPNPFNPATVLSFSLSRSEYVFVTVFDLLGNEIATPVKEELAAGEYRYQFNASGLASGIYYYKFQAGNISSTKKMVLLK